MFQCRFIDCDKCMTLVEDVDIGGDYDIGEAKRYMEILRVQFFWEAKTSLKNEIYEK